MSNNQSLVEIRTVSMYPVDWATVDSYAKDMGYPSTSSALRRIIDEWRQFKGQQLGFDLASSAPTEIPASP